MLVILTDLATNCLELNCKISISSRVLGKKTTMSFTWNILETNTRKYRKLKYICDNRYPNSKSESHPSFSLQNHLTKDANDLHANDIKIKHC